jgi:hypothetical protein
VNKETKEPLVVYHGTNEQFTVFNTYLPTYTLENNEFTSQSLIFTTDNTDVAKYFGNFKQYFVNIKKPFILDNGVTNTWDTLDEYKLIKEIGKKKFLEITNKLYMQSFTYDEWLKYVNEVEGLPISIDAFSYYIKKNKNYDGVIAFDIDETTSYIKSNDFICFKPTQIKLADGTNTTFDANNPDIRYANGGSLNDFKYTIGGL